METNEITGQGQPKESAQNPVQPQSAQVASDEKQLTPPQPEQPHERGIPQAPVQPVQCPVPAITYNPDELARLVSVIRHTTDPEQIILFGSLGGATPFSQITAYDLFILTDNCPREDWETLHSNFNFKVPTRSRAISFINFYLCSSPEADGAMSPFYRFVRSEGEVVYSRKSVKRTTCDYERMYFAALDRYDLYFGQAEGFLEAAGHSLTSCQWRQTAFHTAYAAELLLHALYAAYHAADIDLHQLTTLLLRVRTLSPELFLLLDPERACSSRMLFRLDMYRKSAPYRLNLETDRSEIKDYFDRAVKMKGVIEKICKERLELYKSRIPVTE